MVTFESGESNEAILSGFKIIHGLNLVGNGNIPGGGGITLDHSNPILENLIIKFNSAWEGGGIAGYKSSPIIKFCEISENYAETTSGGMFFDGWDWGGGTGTNPVESYPFISNSTIYNNYAEIEAGAIKFHYSNANIVNSIFPVGESAVMYNSYIRSTILINFTLIGSMFNGYGEGNIDADPLFTDPENGDFTLQPTSPCIDAGDPESEDDPDGTIADMGAFYFDQSSSCDGGYTEIYGECYYQADLDVLQLLIENSQEGENPPPSDLSPIELGDQVWENGRLVEFICTTYYPLNLDYKLSGGIPSSINHLTELAELKLVGNSLGGEIPPEIGNLTNLIYLHLGLDSFSGEIPSEIGNLNNLNVLNLGMNDLTGEIPLAITGMINLHTLLLYSNDLTGEIPLEVGNMESLWHLDFRDNNLTGSIPPEIGNLNLVGLWLHGNQISGEIPPQISQLSYLISLWLNDNQLSGEIPLEIGNLMNLTSLRLNNNQLSGKIPDSICELNELNWSSVYLGSGSQYSNISYIYDNQLCPQYPECIEEHVGEQDTSECVADSIELSLHEGSNLMSFSMIPEDNSVSNVLSGNNIAAIAGEGEAAMNTGTGWVGSLTNILYENGYWLLANDEVTLTLTGIPIQPDQQYALHAGSNLISYSLLDCGSIDEVLPDDVEECIYAIAGEGVAALSTESGWVGSLSELCPDEGYWFVNQCDEITFTFDEPAGLARKEVLSPSPYPYSQSSKQAFYFIESVENIEMGDWILAYSGDKVIGARKWQGNIIDVPAMGSDGSKYTEGYIEAGIEPTFKVQRGGELIDLEGYVPAWSENGFHVVSNLTQATTLPETFNLQKAYPNPFNPNTTISFALTKEINVILEVYDINGRVISKLKDNIMKAGYHSAIWNAESHSSGVYFIRMQAGDFMSIQKLMLVK